VSVTSARLGDGKSAPASIALERPWGDAVQVDRRKTART